MGRGKYISLSLDEGLDEGERENNWCVGDPQQKRYSRVNSIF